MDKTNRISLPEDPREALCAIADFLNKNMKFEGHRYPENADKRSFAGYWQSVDFFYNLKSIAYYAEKYGSSST